MLQVTRTQATKYQTLFNAIRQCWAVPRYQTTPGYMTALFNFSGRMPFLAPTLHKADPLFFDLVIAPGFYLHHIEVVDQHPASDCL